MNKHKRKKLYVFPEVQSKLLMRVGAYWGSCFLFVAIPVVLGRVFNDPSRLFYEHIPDLWKEYRHVAPLFVLLLPLAILDMLRYSNRIVGPLVRIRREMDALTAGNDTSPVKFRDDDEWQDLASAFNRLAEELRQARRLATAGSEHKNLDELERDDFELSRA
ncbi:MAG: HAMP domain-containing protein [Planctomycetota bacterium]|nr:HAMP domain-containing protein [Planctomycetota bacterium]